MTTKFKTRATTKTATKPTAPARRRSRWAGIRAAAPRYPFPEPGEYRFKILSVAEGGDESAGNVNVGADLEVVATDAAHEPGTVVRFLQLISGKSAAPGKSRIKAFIMASCGYSDENEYDENDPDGELIEECICDGALEGRLVDAVVTRGKPRDDGDYYREFAWSPVGEKDQTADA